MSIKTETIHTLYDINKNKILKFPTNTQLDSIIQDLWPNIIKYLNYHPFAFGLDVHLGYRKMTTSEFNKNIEKFKRYYVRNKGLYTFDDIDSFENLLVIDDHYLAIHKYSPAKTHIAPSKKNSKTCVSFDVFCQELIFDKLILQKVFWRDIYIPWKVIYLLVPDI